MNSSLLDSDTESSMTSCTTIESGNVIYNHLTACTPGATITYTDKGWEFTPGSQLPAEFIVDFGSNGINGEDVDLTTIIFNTVSGSSDTVFTEANSGELTKNENNDMRQYVWSNTVDSNNGVISFLISTNSSFSISNIEAIYKIAAIPTPIMGLTEDRKVFLYINSNREYDIYYKIDSDNPETTTLRVANIDDYKEYTSPFEMADNEYVTYYAAHPVSGREGRSVTRYYPDGDVNTEVKQIEADGNHIARYFNLQGGEVLNPQSNQIYIRIIDGEAKKVVHK